MPVDFNIMTLVKIAKHYGTDLTGIQEVFRSFKGEEDSIVFVGTIGSVALTEGARRAADGGDYKRYNNDDVYDMLTVDMTLAEQLLSEFFESMEGSKVFPKAPAKKAPKKRSK